ncbi:MAG: dockerin type I domain-containing protein [Saprospiraceae bacterium]
MASWQRSAVEGNERPVIRYSTASGLCIDRDHTDRDGDSDLPTVDSPTLPNYGRYIYTQFYKVIDNDAPVVTVPAYGVEKCGNRGEDLPNGVFTDIYGSCDALVTIPFTVVDECADIPFDFNLGDIELLSARVYGAEGNWVVDTEGDRQLKHVDLAAWAGTPTSVTLTPTGNGGYTFSGTYAIIPSAAGDNLFYALEVVFQDGCGNVTSEIMEFQVIDCKGPAPVCINGLTVTLMPLLADTDADGDGDDDNCAMAIWASDFEGSPISDCTGQGPDEFLGNPRVTKYAIYRAEDVEAVGVENFVPDADDTGLVLTDDDEPTTVVYVYAFDEEGNYDYCETYVLVQQHPNCGSTTGVLGGVIMTEEAEAVEGVQVSVNGAMAQMVTTENGAFSFELALGGDYSLTPYLNAQPLNGVTTFDLVLMSKHILNVQPLNSPYKLIAADVNRSGTITTLDMIQLRKLILNIDTEFANNTSWRFIPTAYAFPMPANPWSEEFLS